MVWNNHFICSWVCESALGLGSAWGGLLLLSPGVTHVAKIMWELSSGWMVSTGLPSPPRLVVGTGCWLTLKSSAGEGFLTVWQDFKSREREILYLWCVLYISFSRSSDMAKPRVTVGGTMPGHGHRETWLLEQAMAVINTLVWLLQGLQIRFLILEM